MVLLLAALYSFHQHYRYQQQMQQQTQQQTPQLVLNMQDERPEVRQTWVDEVFSSSLLEKGASFCLPTRPNEKLGLTIRRLALGVFVAKVSAEAKASGVVENSLLTKVQGQSVLAEPTRQVVAFLELYQQRMVGPLILEFLHDKKLYQVCLWTRQWGLEWGTCGNFGLVQRVYGHAAAAGIPKGTLLGVVQGQTLHHLDHAQATIALRQAWNMPNDTLQLTCLLPPPDTRSLWPNSSAPSKRPIRTAQSDDGVQVRFYGWGESLCQPWPDSKGSDSNLLPYITSLPTLEPGAILEVNPILDNLLYCLRMDKAKYEDAQTHETWRELLQSPRVAQAFLLPLLSVICDPNVKEASDVTSFLLTLSRRDEGFCQRLYFLLRSYISTFETHRPATVGKEEGDTSQNLLALLHCLELLRFAEKELAHRTPLAIPTTPSNDSSTSPVPVSPDEKPKRVFFWRKKKANHKQSPVVQSKATTPLTPPMLSLTSSQQPSSLLQTPSVMYDNMSDFLSELDSICGTIERSLQKSFRQKIADWAMQPWSASKDTALAQVTHTMRQSLRDTQGRTLLVNPVDSTELLSSVDYDECYILPSAHFPILLTFNVSERRCADTLSEKLYRTTVQVFSISGTDDSCVVHAAVAGTMEATGPAKHEWKGVNNVLIFDTRSAWREPQTVSLRVSSDNIVGFGWVNLEHLWDKCMQQDQRISANYTVNILQLEQIQLNGEGLLEDLPKDLQIDVRISVECIDIVNSTLERKRMLLYKHDDDLRQEAFAIDFIQTCDRILKAAGLDMKLLTFQCIPVGTRRGFVEWVPASVPLSEICQPFAGSILDNMERSNGFDETNTSPSMVSKAGLTKYESLRRLGGQQNDSLRRLGANGKECERGSIANNPVQDYLRSLAYDSSAPYMIRRETMDTYVKSCAGYCVITYILGVGDRHLDNLLLHQSGAFFHCDFSFILGSDPKKHMPMRVTEDMVYGMGGRESDNFAAFLTLVGAAFLTLRRPENVRVLLSLVRIMEPSYLPDVSENQSAEDAILGVRDRLRLDLNENEAVAYMEELVETSLSNKIWIAVDAIHTLGKKF